MLLISLAILKLCADQGNLTVRYINKSYCHLIAEAHCLHMNNYNNLNLHIFVIQPQVPWNLLYEYCSTNVEKLRKPP